MLREPLLRGVDQRVTLILTQEEDCGVVADEHQAAAPARLQHQAEHARGRRPVQRPLIEPPARGAARVPRSTREAEQDYLAGLLFDLDARTAGEQAEERQRRLLTTLEESARQIGASTEAQATRTIEEAGRLMQRAAEAPKAAAEVVAQLRQSLSASMARDNAMLEERSRIMETLGALLDAINHASTEQRGAIDALVASSTALLERSSARFEASVEAESAKLTDVASRIASGAVARYVVSRTAPNPIFDAVKGKLINVPLSLTSYTRGRRR